MTWVLTVVSLRTSAAAISAFDMPARQQPQDLGLARGQLVERGRPGAAGRPMRRELLDQPARDGRGEQRLAAGDGADPVDELGGRRVLEQEAARAGLERVEDVLVEVVGGEHEHARGMRGR